MRKTICASVHEDIKMAFEREAKAKDTTVSELLAAILTEYYVNKLIR